MPSLTFEEIRSAGQVNQQVNQSENEFAIFKTDDDKRLVFGWASISIKTDGKQLEDRQQDIIDPEDLEEAAYEYVLNFRDTGEEHISTMRKKGKLVESCVFTEEKQKAIGIPPGIVPVGWWIGFRIEDDAAWQKVKNGTYKMFSIEGKANREPVGKANHPKGCGVLVVQDGKILAGTRIEPTGNGKLCGPGGHIEEGETPEDAAIREAYEEFGIVCRDIAPIGMLQDENGKDRSAIFLCTKFVSKPKTDEKEMTAPRWMTIEELQKEELYPPFAASLEFLQEDDEPESELTAKSFHEIMKFNPYHDARGRFASSSGYATFTTRTKDPKKQHWADMAVSRLKQRTAAAAAAPAPSKITTAAKPTQAASTAQKPAQAATSKPATSKPATSKPATSKPATSKPAQTQTQTQKPKGTVDSRGFSDYDAAGYHQLYAGKKYYAQQQLTSTERQAATKYLEAYPEPGSLYSHSQNMNYMMATGQKLTGAYKKTHDGMMSAMHNIGYNVNLTRYDHAGMINSLLQAAGAGNDYEKMSASKIKKALVGKTVNENKFLSTSYNDFKNAPPSTAQIFNSRAVKINYKVKAGAKAMMPGVGPGGDFGEIVLAPTNGKANKGGRITDVRLTGQMVRRKGTQNYNQPRIEIDIEID